MYSLLVPLPLFQLAFLGAHAIAQNEEEEEETKNKKTHETTRTYTQNVYFTMHIVSGVCIWRLFREKQASASDVN